MNTAIEVILLLMLFVISLRIARFLFESYGFSGLTAEQKTPNAGEEACTQPMVEQRIRDLNSQQLMQARRWRNAAAQSYHSKSNWDRSLLNLKMMGRAYAVNGYSVNAGILGVSTLGSPQIKLLTLAVPLRELIGNILKNPLLTSGHDHALVSRAAERQQAELDELENLGAGSKNLEVGLRELYSFIYAYLLAESADRDENGVTIGWSARYKEHRPQPEKLELEVSVPPYAWSETWTGFANALSKQIDEGQVSQDPLSIGRWYFCAIGAPIKTKWKEKTDLVRLTAAKRIHSEPVDNEQGVRDVQWHSTVSHLTHDDGSSLTTMSAHGMGPDEPMDLDLQDTSMPTDASKAEAIKYPDHDCAVDKNSDIDHLIAKDWAAGDTIGILDDDKFYWPIGVMPRGNHSNSSPFVVTAIVLGSDTAGLSGKSIFCMKSNVANRSDQTEKNNIGDVLLLGTTKGETVLATSQNNPHICVRVLLISTAIGSQIKETEQRKDQSSIITFRMGMRANQNPPTSTGAALRDVRQSIEAREMILAFKTFLLGLSEIGPVVVNSKNQCLAWSSDTESGIIHPQSEFGLMRVPTRGLVDATAQSMYRPDQIIRQRSLFPRWRRETHRDLKDCLQENRIGWSDASSYRLIVPIFCWTVRDCSELADLICTLEYMEECVAIGSDHKEQTVWDILSKSCKMCRQIRNTFLIQENHGLVCSDLSKPSVALYFSKCAAEADLCYDTERKMIGIVLTVNQCWAPKEKGEVLRAQASLIPRVVVFNTRAVNDRDRRVRAIVTNSEKGCTLTVDVKESDGLQQHVIEWGLLNWYTPIVLLATRLTRDDMQLPSSIELCVFRQITEGYPSLKITSFAFNALDTAKKILEGGSRRKSPREFLDCLQDDMDPEWRESFSLKQLRGLSDTAVEELIDICFVEEAYKLLREHYVGLNVVLMRPSNVEMRNETNKSSTASEWVDSFAAVMFWTLGFLHHLEPMRTFSVERIPVKPFRFERPGNTYEELFKDDEFQGRDKREMIEIDKKDSKKVRFEQPDLSTNADETTTLTEIDEGGMKHTTASPATTEIIDSNMGYANSCE
jgi:hypothetical protein